MVSEFVQLKLAPGLPVNITVTEVPAQAVTLATVSIVGAGLMVIVKF